VLLLARKRSKRMFQRLGFHIKIDNFSIWHFGFLIVVVAALWVGGGLALHFGPFDWSIEERGFIGDSFGSINALFAGCAFAGVVYAILMQREELRLERKELKMTREELARLASAQ